ncbi:MAG: hypothetical protein K9M57_05880, partial [Phycisphaerae bacterium]|nr:hypothetical protein [Phycisphaerae bacterium]
MKIVKILIPFFMMSFIFAGCQGVTPVNTKTLKKPAVKASGEILIGDMALEVRKESANVVGYHSFTVFALRTVPIHAEYPPGMQTA